MGPLLEPVHVPLDGVPSLRRIDHTTQLGVICKLAEGAVKCFCHRVLIVMAADSKKAGAKGCSLQPEQNPCIMQCVIMVLFHVIN